MWADYLTDLGQLRPRASLITVPTLFVQGGLDPLFDIEASRAFVEKLPSGQVIEVPRIGHELQDRTDVLLPIVATFLMDALLRDPSIDEG